MASPPYFKTMEKVKFNNGEVRQVTSRYAGILLAKGEAELVKEVKEEKQELQDKAEKAVVKTKGRPKKG